MEGEPTKEQLEQLNKWCGTEGINYYEGIEALGFLFKYAVPKVDFWLASQEKSKRVGVQVQYLGKLSGLIFGETLALALFWAIYQVKED